MIDLLLSCFFLCIYFWIWNIEYNQVFELEFISDKQIKYIEFSDIGKILKISDNFVSIQNNLTTINTNNYNNDIKNRNIDINDEKTGLKFANEFEDKDFFI